MTNPPPQPVATNGLAIAGFVLAICAVVLFWFPVVGQVLWILGLIFSAIGLSKARQTEGRPQYRLAVAGVAISLIGAVIFVIGLVILIAAA